MRSQGYALLALMGVATTAALGADAIVSSFQQSSIQGVTTEGWAGGLDWVHPLPPSTTTIFGVSWRQIGLYHRLLAHAGEELSPVAGLTIDADFAAGDVHDGVSNYSHVQTLLRLGYAFTPRISIALEDQYVSAGPLHGELRGALWTYRPVSVMTIQIKQLLTVAGNLNSQATSARVDYIRRADLFVGAAAGSAAPQLSDKPIFGSGAFKEVYAGIAHPIGRTIFTLLADRYVTANSRQWTTTLLANVPLPEHK
jgi:hypothetical protein